MCEHCQNVKIPPLSRPLFSDRYRCPACGAEFREVVRIGEKRIGTPILVWMLQDCSICGLGIMILRWGVLPNRILCRIRVTPISTVATIPSSTATPPVIANAGVFRM